MDLAAAVDLGRKIHLDILTDRLLIERPTGHTTDDNGTRTTVYTKITDTPGLAQALAPGGALATHAAGVNGLPVTSGTYVVKIPLATSIKKRDRVTVTESITAVMIGRRFIVTEVPASGLSIIRRVIMDEA